MAEEVNTANDNRVEAVGRIAKIIHHDNVSTIVLMTKNGTRETFPHFIVQNDMLSSGSFSINDNVKITGRIRLRGYVSGKKHRAAQQFFADSIAPVPSMLEEVYGVRGRIHTVPYIRVFLHGVVDSTASDHGYDRIAVIVPDHSGKNIRIHFSQKSNGYAPNAGDEIYVAAGVITSVRRLDGDKDKSDQSRGHAVWYEDILAMDTFIIPAGKKSVDTDGHRVFVKVNDDVKAEAEAQKEEDAEETYPEDASRFVL